MQGYAGLKVVELSGSIAAGFCGKLFAGFGAEVIRVDGVQSSHSLSAEEQAWLHTGKRWLQLDAAAPQSSLAALIASADIVIDGWPIDALASLGLDAATLAARHPQLILCQISPYGQTGPQRLWQADAITLYAQSGLMQCTGDGTREPLNAGFHLVETTAGLNALIACLMALRRRARDGVGDSIDLSLQESAMENGEVALMEYVTVGKIARRAGDNHAMVPWRTYVCADGEATIIGGPIRNWLRAATIFEAPALLDAPYQLMSGRMQHRAEVETLMRPWLLKQTRRDLFRQGQAAGLAWSFLASIGEALHDPQFTARGYFTEVDDPKLGRCRMPNAPFRSSALHWQTRPAAAAPEARVADRDSFASAATLAVSAPADAPVAPPMAGIRVLDLTHDWAGPHCARVLADFGAEVLKIEYPQRLDGMRGGYQAKVNEHPRFWQLHRNKGSVALDLRNAEHRLVFEALVREADLVIENSRPGVMARLGYDYAALRALKDDIILLSMSAFGADGPYAQYAGYGGTLEAICGIQDLTAYSPEGRRFRVREMDVTNGIFGACAALTALWQRQTRGHGQWIELAESETSAWLMGEQFIAEARAPGSVQPRGNRHAQHAPQGCYRCAGDDRWLSLSVRSDEQWQHLAQRIGGAALDAAYASVAARRAQHEQIDALITQWTAQHDAGALTQQLQAAGIAAAPVCNAADLASDPHLQARQWWMQLGTQRFPGLPFKLARGGGSVRQRGPDLGERNAALFAAQQLTPPDVGPEHIRTAYELS